MNKQKHPEKQGEFQELVDSIRAAEAESDKVKTDFDAKAAELMKHGREKSVEMRESYDKKAAETRNRLLAAEREKTEKLAEEMVADARKEASALRAKKLDKKGVDAVFEAFVSSL